MLALLSGTGQLLPAGCMLDLDHAASSEQQVSVSGIADARATLLAGEEHGQVARQGTGSNTTSRSEVKAGPPS